MTEDLFSWRYGDPCQITSGKLDRLWLLWVLTKHMDVLKDIAIQLLFKRYLTYYCQSKWCYHFDKCLFGALPSTRILKQVRITGSFSVLDGQYKCLTECDCDFVWRKGDPTYGTKSLHDRLWISWVLRSITPKLNRAVIQPLEDAVMLRLCTCGVKTKDMWQYRSGAFGIILAQNGNRFANYHGEYDAKCHKCDKLKILHHP